MSRKREVPYLGETKSSKLLQHYVRKIDDPLWMTQSIDRRICELEVAMRSAGLLLEECGLYQRLRIKELNLQVRRLRSINKKLKRERGQENDSNQRRNRRKSLSRG